MKRERNFGEDDSWGFSERRPSGFGEISKCSTRNVLRERAGWRGGQGDQIKQGTIRALPKTILTANERKWARIQSISYFESEVGG
jgi:hypothetical protein